MKTRIVSNALRRLVPPDREIIVRTGDSVTYLQLPRWLQVGVMLSLAVALAWIGLATHLNFNNLEIIAKREARIADTERARHEVLDALEQARHEASLAAQRVQVNQQHARKLAERNRGLQDEIDALTARLIESRATIAQEDAKQRKLASKVDALHGQLASLEAQRKQQLADAAARHDREMAARESELEKKIAALETERHDLSGDIAKMRETIARAEREKARMSTRIAKLLPQIDRLEAAQLEQTKIAAGLRDRLAERTGERDRVIADRDRLTAERDAIAGRFASLTDQLDTLESAQEQVINRFDNQTVDSIELVEKTLSRTGVDVDRLLGRLTVDHAEDGGSGIGGPFIAALDEAGVEQAAELAGNIAAVEQRVTRWRGLQELLAHMPLTVPLDSYRITSTFGRRIDPMTERPAMHEGIDFGSEHRAEVHATSPGRVSFVGWRGGYGKMVEVDHGLGIRTRYAHLSKIYVKAGQKVDFRDKLGQVGNTGRSTGEHLHYEIMVDGRALDPANFMKAGQYVFKN